MAIEASKWDSLPLDALTEEQTPITYGVVKPGDEGDVPFIRGGDIAGGRVLLNQLRTIDGEVSRQYRRTLLRGGEILVSLVGNPGQIAIAPPELAGANIARQVGLVRLKPGLDTRFVSYFLQSRDGQLALGAQSIGSVQQVINLRDLKTVKVPVPPLAEQKAIAAVLGALDDKIELNRRMNATLEAMARALFQSWFVDFEPVRAKLDGRVPLGMDSAAADLFPASFEHSKGTLIPTGWKSVVTSEIFQVRDGTHDSPKPQAVGYPLITSKHITKGTVDVANAYLISEEDFSQINKRSKVDRFDTLMTMIGTVGIPLLVHEEEPRYAIKNIALFKTSATPELAYYFYLYLSSPEMQRFLESRLAGTTQKFLSLGILRNLPVMLPDPRVISAFSRICRPVFAAMESHRSQSETLITTRDTLLPKLLNGEINASQVDLKA